jgi:hypothetical protein
MQDTTKRQLGITTRYAGPTETKGSRIIARWTDWLSWLSYRPVGAPVQVAMSYDDALDANDNHFTAASKLLAASTRSDHWHIVGRMDDSLRGYCFVLDIDVEAMA